MIAQCANVRYNTCVPRTHETEMLQNEAWIAIERFSNDCRKIKTKVITSTNHNRNKQRREPIRIPSNYL